MADSCATCAYSRVVAKQATYNRATATTSIGPARQCHANP